MARDKSARSSSVPSSHINRDSEWKYARKSSQTKKRSRSRSKDDRHKRRRHRPRSRERQKLRRRRSNSSYDSSSSDSDGGCHFKSWKNKNKKIKTVEQETNSNNDSVDKEEKFNSDREDSNSDLCGIYDSEDEDEAELVASGGLSTPEERAKQLRDVFPNVPPAILLEIANKNDPIDSAIDQLLNCKVESRVGKSLILLKHDELFKKVTLTERRGFDPDDPLEQKFRLAKDHYLSRSDHLAKQIERIDYVENRIIMELFEKKKDQLLSEGKDAKECLLFHETSSDNIDNILENNFGMDFGGKNGQNYGGGIYFSEKTIIPDKYCFGNKNALLLCRVLLGEEFLDDGPGNIPDGYDSKLVNPEEESGAKIYVIKDVDQILPCFVLNLAASTCHSPLTQIIWLSKDIREAEASSLPPPQAGVGSSSTQSLPLGASARHTSSHRSVLPCFKYQSQSPHLSTEEAEMQLAIKLSLASPNLDVMTEEAQLELAMNLSLVSEKGDHDEMEQLMQAMVLSITEKSDAQ